MPPAIDADNLTKRFPAPRHLRDLARLRAPARNGTLAVDHVTIRVEEGEIFGLLGPNGAGKTTLVKMLSTLILPTEGRAWVNGTPLERADAVKASIGLMTANERSFYPRLTCHDNLHFYGGLAQLTPAEVGRKIAWLSDVLDLGGFVDKRYDRCSTGMKHRLALARALLNDASLLFLDEPTVTLDPVAADQFRERLYALVHQERRTVFMVTHNVDEAVEVCSRVAVMLAGRLTVVGSPERLRELLQSEPRCEVRINGFSTTLARHLEALEDVRALTVEHVAGSAARVTLHLRDRKRSMPAVAGAVEAVGGTLAGLEMATASWEEVGRRLEGEGRSDRLPYDAAARGLPVAAGPGAHIQPVAARPRERVALPPVEPAVQRQGVGRAVADRCRELVRAVPLFLKRDLRMQMNYRFSFLLQLLGIVFSIASFYFVGQVFGMQASPFLQAYGGDYFSFVLIGIAFLGYQSAALYGFAGVIQSAQSGGTLEAMLTTPTRLSTILLGSSVWNFVFTSFRVVLYLLAGVLFFGARFSDANLVGAAIVLALTVTSLGAIGILSASFIMVFKRGNPINFLLGGASTLLGGVYYPVEVLPAWLQPVARLYPLTTSLQGMRRALLTGASLGELGGEIGLLLAFSAVLLPLSLVAFRYAVRQAKRDGSLTQY